MPGKRVQFDDETWQALDVLGRDTGKKFQELAIEAFGDLLRKHDRPIGLKAALRWSAGASATITPLPGRTAANRNRPKEPSSKLAPRSGSPAPPVSQNNL